jgi:hypothetical protein
VQPAGWLVLSLGISLLALTCNRRPEGKDRSYTSAVPAFSISYPDRWQPEKPRYDHEVFRATDPSALPSLAIDTYDPSEANGIDEQYSDKFMKYLKFLFPRASEFKLVAHDLVSLPDGTRAAQTCCEWTWEDGATRLASYNVSAVKDHRLVSVTCTGLQGTPSEQLARYPRTLSFARK